MKQKIANTLLEHETITKEQIDYLVENGSMPSEEVKEASLMDLNITELRALAKEKGIKGYTKLTKEELIKLLDEE